MIAVLKAFNDMGDLMLKIFLLTVFINTFCKCQMYVCDDSFVT